MIYDIFAKFLHNITTFRRKKILYQKLKLTYIKIKNDVNELLYTSVH